MDAYVTPRIVTIPPALVDTYALRLQERYAERKIITGRMDQLDEDVWGNYGNVAPHTDGVGDERVGFVVQGLVLACGFECQLVTENHRLPLVAGCAYRLNPNIEHAMEITSRWQTPFIFLAWDQMIDEEMTPHVFVATAIDSLQRRMNAPTSS